jgi:hypothetical protein
VHDCEFCKSDDLPLAEGNNEKLLLGTSEIRVFSTQGEIYAAPTLIYHYASVHHYKPPDEFVRTLTEGPQPESREYFDRLKDSKNWLSSGTEHPLPPESVSGSNGLHIR